MLFVKHRYLILCKINHIWNANQSTIYHNKEIFGKFVENFFSNETLFITIDNKTSKNAIKVYLQLLKINKIYTFICLVFYNFIYPLNNKIKTLIVLLLMIFYLTLSDSTTWISISTNGFSVWSNSETDSDWHKKWFFKNVSFYQFIKSSILLLKWSALSFVFLKSDLNNRFWFWFRFSNRSLSSLRALR